MIAILNRLVKANGTHSAIRSDHIGLIVLFSPCTTSTLFSNLSYSLVTAYDIVFVSIGCLKGVDMGRWHDTIHRSCLLDAVVVHGKSALYYILTADGHLHLEQARISSTVKIACACFWKLVFLLRHLNNLCVRKELKIIYKIQI